MSLFAIELTSDGEFDGLSGSSGPRLKLRSGQWYTATVRFSLSAGRADLTVLGHSGSALSFPLLRRQHQGAINYFSFQALGPGGICVSTLHSNTSAAGAGYLYE